jgi:excisionase family DNA binding protein
MAKFDALMTPADVAPLLGVSVNMVRLLEAEGRLPAQRTAGGVRLFRLCDVQALVAERKKNPPRRGRKPKAKKGGRLNVSN